jgi:hypothetical protein
MKGRFRVPPEPLASSPAPAPPYVPKEEKREGCTCDTEEHEAHPCPYEEEIHDNHEDHCTCCPVCTQHCREEI